MHFGVLFVSVLSFTTSVESQREIFGSRGSNIRDKMRYSPPNALQLSAIHLGPVNDTLFHPRKQPLRIRTTDINCLPLNETYAQYDDRVIHWDNKLKKFPTVREKMRKGCADSHKRYMSPIWAEHWGDFRVAVQVGPRALYFTCNNRDLYKTHPKLADIGEFNDWRIVDYRFTCPVEEFDRAMAALDEHCGVTISGQVTYSFWDTHPDTEYAWGEKPLPYSQYAYGRMPRTPIPHGEIVLNYGWGNHYPICSNLWRD